MTKRTVTWISRAYLILALLAAVLLSPLAYSPLALILLILEIYTTWRPPRAGLGLAFTVSTLVLTPLTLQPWAGSFLAAVLVIPALPLLDQALRRNALDQPFEDSLLDRTPTGTSIAFGTALLVLFITSVLLGRWTLSFTSIILASYFVSVLGYVLYKTTRTPLKESTTWTRVIAGDTVITSATIEARTKMPLRVRFQAAYPWVHLDPSELKLQAKTAQIALTLTPPLAGPSKLQLQASVIDPWGLTQINQILEPVELYVIPRARYAAWLARKYLEQTTPGAASIVPAHGASTALRGAKGGVEYLSSRPYQAGDRLKDMDWKHTLKLNELIVKEYIEAQGQMAIIAVNLTVVDAEEADRLAYNLITSALTLAREAVPTSLAAYNHKDVVMATGPTNPRETVKTTLKLAQDIVQIEPLQRFLQPPDIQRLRRAIGQLEETKSEPADKLAAILRLEYEAIQEAAKEHPATRALTEATRHGGGPGVILLISSRNHDAEALVATLDRLQRKGYAAVTI